MTGPLIIDHPLIDMAVPPDTTTTFSHDVALAAITRYYQFLERLCGSGTTKYPPEGGWPQIQPHLAEHMNMGPEALRLVRHLPTFARDVVPECRPYNYPGEFAKLQATIKEPETKPPQSVYETMPAPDAEFPPHVFPLVWGGYRLGSRLAIDTKRGVAIWHNSNEDSQLKPWPEPDAPSEIDYDSDPEAHEPLHSSRGWRAAPTYRIETFFAMAEEHLKLLNWIPNIELSECNIEEPKRALDEEQQARIKIMRDAGWPGDNWDLERARSATNEWKDARDELEMAEERMKKASLEANL